MLVEIGGYGDDRPIDRLAQMRFGILLERLEHQTRKLFGSEAPARQLNLPVGPHVPLEGARAALGLHHLQFLGGPADENLAVVVDAHRRRSEHVTQRVRDELRPCVGEIPDGGKRSPQIDSDNSAHEQILWRVLCSFMVPKSVDDCL